LVSRANKLTRKQRARINLILAIFWFILLALIVRTGWIQIVQGENLRRAAVEQQTRDRIIAPRRGTIYDRNGVPLATSRTVEQITADPADINSSTNEETNAARRNLIANGLSEILEMDRDVIYNRLNQRVANVVIRRRVEKEQADAVRAFVEENRIRGINIDEDVMRHYQYNNFASHVIGFVGMDNQGLNGLELVFDRYLRGTPGRVVSARDAAGREMAHRYERYISPQDGLNLVLTIDEAIQHFAEKHLETALIEHNLAMGAAAIVMDVQTGEVLAMATQPDFDLNAPLELSTDPRMVARFDAFSEAHLSTADSERLAELDGEERERTLNSMLHQMRLNYMWRNKAVVDSYEPGSTFKIATLAMGLEEGVVSLNDRFYCSGAVRRGTYTIRCHNRNGHGMQTFAEAVQNSCNPMVIEIAERMGRDTFYRYMHGMGFTQRTGLELPGETSGIFFNRNNFNELELVTSSFGQGFQVTPLQLISITSAMANGGNLFRPRLVRQLTDSDGNVVQSFEPEIIRQIISRETSDTLNAVLETTVTSGTGRNAYIPGFRVAGKTGTSEKIPRGLRNYIASFVGFAPADNPRIAVLVILDEPRGASYFGGVIAAPVVRNILEESLQYLGIEPEFTQEEIANMEVPVPNVTQMTREQAQRTLRDSGLNAQFHGDGDVVLSQIPRPREPLARNSTIILHTEGANARQVTVPNVVDMSVADANRAIVNAGLNIRIRGGPAHQQGRVICTAQFPAAGAVVDAGSIVTIEFRHLDIQY